MKKIAKKKFQEVLKQLCGWMRAYVLVSQADLEPMDTTVRIKRGAISQDKHMTTGRINKSRGD